MATPHQHQYSPTRGEELDTTEATQANRKMTSFRVLMTSMILAAVVGIVLVAAFWKSTPPAMDRSSGGKLGESAPVTAPPKPATPPPATTP